MTTETVGDEVKAFQPGKMIRNINLSKRRYGAIGLIGIALIAMAAFKLPGNNISQFTGPVSPGEPLPAVAV